MPPWSSRRSGCSTRSPRPQRRDTRHAAHTPAAARHARKAKAPAFHQDTTPLGSGVTSAGSGSAAAPAVSSAGADIIRTIVGLAVVLAVIYGVYWLLKSSARAKSGRADERIGVIATTPLAPNRSLHLVRAGDELILVGATEHTITPLRVYTADEAHARRGHGRRHGALAPARDAASAQQPAREPAQADGPGMSALPLLATAGSGISINGNALSTPVEILVSMTLLAILPGALLMMTGFTRILIVLGFVRNALGTPTSPPSQVLVGMSLILTIFVMAPTFKQINSTAIQPYTSHEITLTQAADRGQQPLRTFMFNQTRDSDLAMFVRMANLPRPKTRADIPTYVLVPAFMISELKTAFQIGFLIYLPFLIIDMVVASTLMSMGMMMLPPVLISLPFKIMLFVLVDGWHLVIQSLVQSFHT